jgi:sugar-phosphatase
MAKAVIFDMDGLLVDSEPCWRRAEMECFARVGIPLTEADCRETMGYRLSEVVELWYHRKPWTGPSLLEMERSIIDRVTEYILTYAEPLPGVLSAIELCRSRGRIAVASSSPMVLIEAVVKRFGLEGVFDVLHSAQHEAYGKPHPAVFIHAAAMLGVAPHTCTVIEDSFHGMVAGLAARMRTVVVPAPEAYEDHRWAAAHLKLPSLAALDYHML